VLVNSTRGQIRVTREDLALGRKARHLPKLLYLTRAANSRDMQHQIWNNIDFGASKILPPDPHEPCILKGLLT
jgi:hypothetical protein